MQAAIYLSVALDIFCFICGPKLLQSHTWKGLAFFMIRLQRLKVYQPPLYSKLFTLTLICLVSVGPLSKKQKDFNPKNSVGYPLAAGLALFFGSLWFYGQHGLSVAYHLSWYDIAYIVFAFAGTALIHTSMDNVSKMISTSLGNFNRGKDGDVYFLNTMNVTFHKTGENVPRQQTFDLNAIIGLLLCRHINCYPACHLKRIFMYGLKGLASERIDPKRYRPGSS